MNPYRLIISIITVYLITISLFHIYTNSKAAADGSTTRYSPSKTYITKSFRATRVSKATYSTTPSDMVCVGDLLIGINDNKVESVRDVSEILSNSTNRNLIYLTIFRPNQDLEINFQVDRTNFPDTLLAPIDLSIYIKNIREDGAAYKAGIRQGDLIIKINEQNFDHIVDADFLTKSAGIIHGALTQAFGSYGITGTVFEAEQMMYKAGHGNMMNYEILRDSQIIKVKVPWVDFGYDSSLMAILLMLFSAIYAFYNDSDLKKRYFAVKSLFLLFVFLIWSFRQDIVYSSFAWTRDITFGIAFLLLFIPRIRFEKIDLIFEKMLQNLRKPRKPKPSTKPQPPVPTMKDRIRIFKYSLSNLWQYHFVVSSIAASILLKIALELEAMMPALPRESNFGYFSSEGLRTALFHRDQVPIAILWVFLFGFCYLLKIWHYFLPSLYLSNSKNRNLCLAIKQGNYKSMADIVNAQLLSGEPGYYSSRLYQLIRRYNQDPDISVARAMRDDILSSDEEKYSLSLVWLSWCEIALPILGFLGTVVGMRDAFGNTSASVKKLLINAKDLTVFDEIDRAFKGVGVAFDTTFLGLAGLLILGLLHFALKKHLAVRISEAREIFDKVISHAVVGSAAEELMNATYSREMMNSLMEKVIIEDPTFNSIKKVLLKPLIEFTEIRKGLSKHINTYVDKMLKMKKWEFKRIGLSVSDTIAIQIVSNKEQAWILRFSLRNNDEIGLYQTKFFFRQLFPANNQELLLGVSEDNLLIIMKLTRDVNEQNRNFVVLGSGFSATNPILPLFVDGVEFALILKDEGGITDLYSIPMIHESALAKIGHLPLYFRWKLWDFHLPTSTFVAVGESQDGGQQRLILHSVSQRLTGSEGKTRPELVLDEGKYADLPQGVVPKQVVVLSKNEVILLSNSGKLFYWLDNVPSFFPMKHPDRQDHLEDSNCIIQSGNRRWVALFENTALSMWRISLGGHMTPYEGRPQIVGKIDPDNLKTTGDGESILTLVDKQIISWRFPGAVIDLYSPNKKGKK